MIWINRGSSNRCIFTLNEKRTISSPYYYIFEFTNQQTKESKVFYMTNTSVNRDRYDSFILIEDDTEDLLNGIVKLPVGEYLYTVYESSIITLDLSLVGSVVEIGKSRVKEDTLPTPTFTPTYNQTISVFTPTI